MVLLVFPLAQAVDLNPKIHIYSLLGEPLKAKIEFVKKVKSARIDSIRNAGNLQNSDFKLAIKSGILNLSSHILISEPVLELWLNIEFADHKKIHQQLTLLLPIADQVLQQSFISPEGFKKELLQNKVQLLKTQLGQIENNLSVYRNIAYVLAILILMGFWLGLRYRRKLLNLSSKSYFMDTKSSVDNNDYLLEVAHLYVTQEKFTEAENLAQEVLRVGNPAQQKKAQTILDAKA